MKFTAVSCLLAAICSASYVLADAIAAPEVLEAQPNIEARATDTTTTTTAAATQAATVTTEWFESTIDFTTTYVEIIYTQTFASVPDQWTTAGAGSIGYGTLTNTKDKRDEPVETGYAQPVVLEIQHVIVTQNLQPVEEVLILHTVEIIPNATAYSFNGTFDNNGTVYSGYNETLGNSTSSGGTPSTNLTGSTTNTTTSSSGGASSGFTPSVPLFPLPVNLTLPSNGTAGDDLDT